MKIPYKRKSMYIDEHGSYIDKNEDFSMYTEEELDFLIEEEKKLEKALAEKGISMHEYELELFRQEQREKQAAAG